MPGQPGVRGRPRRWRLRLAVGAGLLVLALGLALYVVTRSWFIIAWITPEMEQRAGGRIEISRAVFSGPGRIVLDEITLHAHGHESAAGRVCRIGRAQIDLTPWRLLLGRVHVRDISLDDVHVRVSEHARYPGRFNVLDLMPDWPEMIDARDPWRPPRIRIHEARVEFGAHDGAGYVAKGERVFAGAMQPDDVRDGTGDEWYRLALHEIDQQRRTIEDGLHITGRLNVETFSHEAQLDGLTLDEATYRLCPQIVRAWWEQMDLRGEVGRVSVTWDSPGEFLLEMRVRKVGLVPPDVPDLAWARYASGRIVPGRSEQATRPHLAVTDGVIRIGPDRMELDHLVGRMSARHGEAKANDEAADQAEAIAMPFRLNFSLDDLPRFTWENREAWTAHVLEVAPFVFDLVIEDFTLPPRDDDAHPRPSREVVLPLMVAEAFERLELDDWSLHAHLEIARDSAAESDIGEDAASGRVRTRGEVRVDHATGRYERFPYPLRNVAGSIHLDGEWIRIERIAADTVEGGRMRLSGEIGPIVPDARRAGFDINIAARDLPVDDQLREALGAGHRDVFDAVMHTPSYVRLREADLFDATGFDYAMGGRVNVDMRLARPNGSGPESADAEEHDEPRVGGERVNMTGVISLQDVGLMVKYFPYPLVVESGRIAWSRHEIRIIGDKRQPGLIFRTPGGGKGLATGRLERVHDDDAQSPENGGPRIRPHLHFDVTGDALNEFVYAVIPPSQQERETEEFDEAWPGLVLAERAQMLRTAGLQAVLNYQGIVAPGEDGRTDFDFDLRVEGASAEPSEAFGQWIGAVGLIWPEEFSLTDIAAELRIQRGRVAMKTLTGKHPNGRVLAAGHIDRRDEPGETVIDVTFEDLPLGEYLIDLAPTQSVDAVRDLWNRYEPDGRFTARIDSRARGDDPLETMLLIHPSVSRVDIDGEPVTMKHDAGQLVLRGQIVTFDDLALQIERDGADHGRLELAGRYGLGEGEDRLSASGTWHGGRFESPLIDETLRLIGAEDHARQYQDLRPLGTFDAQFSYRSPTDDTPQSYRFELRPHEVTCVYRETPMKATFEEGATVIFLPGRIELAGLAGRHEPGSFRVDGAITFDEETDAPIRAILDLSAETQLMHQQVQALLPAAVRDLLAHLEFDDGERTVISGGELTLERAGDPVGGQAGDATDAADGWRASFTGSLHTHGASFVTGVRVTDARGRLDVNVTHHPGETPRVRLDANFEQLRAAGRLITDAESENVRLSEDGRTVLLPEFRGSCYGGVIVAEARTGVGDHLDYEARLELTGVSLREFMADGDFGLLADEAAASGASPREGRRDRYTVRGDLYASLRLAGKRGDLASRSGRGTVRVMQGSLAGIPLLLRIAQLTQFTLQVTGDLNFVDIDFYLDGERAVFERILMESTMGNIAVLQLIGHGSLNLESNELQTWFRSRGAWHGVRDVIGGVGDQLYLIEVGGTLDRPRTRILPIPGLTGGDALRDAPRPGSP